MGVDSSATGVVALLEIARLFSALYRGTLYTPRRARYINLTHTRAQHTHTHTEHRLTPYTLTDVHTRSLHTLTNAHTRSHMLTRSMLTHTHTHAVHRRSQTLTHAFTR